MKNERPTTKICKHCKTEIPYGAKVCPQCRKNQGMGIVPKAIIGIAALAIVGSILNGLGSDSSTSNIETEAATVSATVVATEIAEETVNDETTVETVAETVTETVTETIAEKKTIPTEYRSALKSATVYSDAMHMSKASIYDQLTSEYGEKFSAEAAQYAIDNMIADWNTNALKMAKSYQDMAMSPAAIHDQLTSEYGEKFTQEEADYAIANLD